MNLNLWNYITVGCLLYLVFYFFFNCYLIVIKSLKLSMYTCVRHIAVYCSPVFGQMVNAIKPFATSFHTSEVLIKHTSRLMHGLHGEGNCSNFSSHDVDTL